ncbi:mettl21a [Symbiodinium sp. CCMP2456]|nr:mettl21a [Symbiodinium sp. CCMP2456]
MQPRLFTGHTPNRPPTAHPPATQNDPNLAAPQPPAIPVTLPVPEDWLQDNDYLDTRRSIGNLCCPRHVVSSSWAREKGIAGIPATGLHPAHFLYQGWNSYWLRWIASGKETYFVVARTKAEMILAGELLSQIRAQGLDIDAAATNHAVQTQSSQANLAVKALAQPEFENSKVRKVRHGLLLTFQQSSMTGNLKPGLTLNDRKKSELQDWLKQVEDWVEAQEADDFLTKIRRTAVIWGIPPGTVTKLQKHPVAKLIAVGSYMERWGVAQWCCARIAIHEAHRTLPDTHVLRGVFRALGVLPGYPSFQQFCAESVLYIRFSPVKKHAKLFYVGSTEKSVMVREHTRYRKYKQVLEDKLVSAELSIRFWAHHRNFWDWCVIPVSQTVATDVLRGREQALIQALQPPPNFPFIARWFCPRRGVIKPPDATQATKIGLSRLWRKHRKKQLTTTGRGLPTPLYAMFEKPSFRTKEATWVLLTQLGSNTVAHFEAAKRLRGNEFSYPALCALCRMAKHLPACMAPNALRAITSAFKFRGFLPPKGHRPLRVPFLSHETYRQDLRTCMRAYISESTHAVTPFHVPKTTVVFPRHPHVAQVLHNHQDALRQWALRREPTCKCDVTQNYAPKAPMFGGHIAAKGTEFTNSLSTLEQQIASGSTTDTFFPDKEQLRTQFVEGWSNWCRTNALPGPPRGLNETFQQEVPRMFEEQLKRVQKAAKRDLQRRYPWAFRRTPLIPQAYALPKRKKATSQNFHSGTSAPLHCRNQDLAGFFNSISQSQFLQAWCITLEFYRQRHGVQSDTTFSVNLKAHAQQLRVFRGKRRNRASREVTIWCQDLPTIIRHALTLQHFQVAARGFRQCFGSPMVSPLSPALCGMVIAAQEEIWRRTFSITCSNMNRALLSLRYVDNRIWISERRFEQLPGIRLLLNNHFYGGDITLEDEPAYDFVGFSLDFEQRRIMYNRACQTSDLPSTKSAAPEHVLLSGVLARAHTVKKCSYPRAQALMDLRRPNGDGHGTQTANAGGGSGTQSPEGGFADERLRTVLWSTKKTPPQVLHAREVGLLGCGLIVSASN